MINEKEFNKKKNYLQEVLSIDRTISIVIGRKDLVDGLLEVKNNIIDSVQKFGTKAQKLDIIEYIINTGINSDNTLLERGLAFKDSEYLDSNQNYSLGCYDDPGQSYSPYTAYFKFFNHRDFNSATKVARITFLNPSYIHHKDPYGKQPWTLSTKERKDLNNILHRVVNGQEIWFWLTYEFFLMTGLDFNFGNIVPDYNNILPEVNKELTKNDNTTIKKPKRNARIK